MTDNPVQCPCCSGYHSQGGYAMAKLIERLAHEGYIVREKQDELLEKAANMKVGKPFVTNEVLRRRAEYAAKNQTVQVDDEGEPATLDLGDFLK